MYTSNAQEVFGKLRKNLQAVQKVATVQDKTSRATLLSILALVKKRVFEEGRNANGKGFGTYSKEYYNKVRKANNNSSTKINLELTGDMRREFILDNDGKSWVIGFIRSGGEQNYSYKKEFTGKRKSKNNPNKQKGVLRVNTTVPVSGDRAALLEKRYGIIFNLSKEESEKLRAVFEYEINKRLNG